MGRVAGRVARRVVVVGAGVTGLSCAVRLAQEGHRVDVLARDLPLETTSVVAAALWYPYKALPQDRVTAWSASAYDEFAALAEQDGTGVRMSAGTEVLHRPTEDPWWAGAVPDLEHTAPPEGYADAWSFTAPVIDMPVYLSWLRSRLAALGGTVTRMSLRVLPQPDVSAGDVVVNCAGLGSRLLAQDHDVRPVRGQVVLMSGVRLDRWWLDAAGPTYVVPRAREIVVGGTDQADDWSRTPSPETAAAIVERATRLVPELAGAEVVGHRVGLRPVRSEVRLEVEGRVVHCYGQGGAGVTLSWGCADEVVRLVERLS
ncbi:MAG: FAD-dependent oxidoreductase [Marmoricola sp.]